MASFVTNRGARDLSVETSGTQIDWSADTIKARLVASSVTPTKDDTSMTGLTAIGTDQTLGSKTFTEDTTNDRIVYDAADPTWTAVAGGSTVGWVVIFKFVTNDAGSTPIAVIDVTDTATNGGDITVQFSSSGIFYLQQ
jgi:hypothetical protein